jgi:hypothetical protein
MNWVLMARIAVVVIVGGGTHGGGVPRSTGSEVGLLLLLLLLRVRGHAHPAMRQTVSHHRNLVGHGHGSIVTVGRGPAVPVRVD